MRAFTTVGVRTLRTTSKNNQENQENLTTNNTTTPTRRPTTRTPLQPRDQNAMRVPPKGSQPLAVKSGTNMPLDKQNASRRPLMPKLGANPKQGSKSPLTPRVAGSTTPAATTPAARRAARVERPENGTTTTHKEDLSVPGSYLSNNVTPRSGPRKVRVDSPNNTPTTGHPQSTADLPRIAQDLTYGQGLGINGMERDASKRANVSFSPTVSDISYASPPATADSKFFFASDVKSGAPTQAPKPTLQKSSSFFYANGDSIPPPLKSGGSTVGSSIGEESCQPKFFHANDTPDLHASPQFGPPRSTVSNSSRITSPRLAPTAPIISHRPASPQKLGSHTSVTSLKSAPGRTSPAFSRPGPGGRGQSAQGSVASRRTSLESSQRLGHGRTGSLGSMVEAKTPSGRKVSYGSPEPQGPLTPALALSPISISTPEGRLEEEDEEVEDEDEVKEEVASEPSPIKAGHSIEHMNELAAEARRERKVLDLEITNSSLEAINRTLERQMRKQTAELRRYRRLSRSGRLSINTAGSSRISSINLSAMDGVEGPDLSDMSEEDGEDGEEDGEDEEIFSSEEDTPDDGSLSPGAMAESDARHRTRDEKRLQLDLSKHQQLLVDSQKMNQSLKRCLGWTEELINEGKKALEYHVRVSDVDLPKSLAENFGHGGRVLAPDEVSFNQAEEDEENERIMSGLHSPLLREVMNLAPWGGLGRDDRDSGIELDPERGMPQEPLQREPQ